MQNLPEAFIRQCKDLLGDEADSFFDSLQRPPLVSLRLNPVKKETDLTTNNRVSWAENGFYLDTKPVFTLDPFFHAGHYYVQEASSMILESIIRALPLQKVSAILDLCAAPGGKTTHLLDLLPEESWIHAHEAISGRAEILRQNVERWGRTNACITRGNINSIIRSGNKYQLVLVDAPCSGEGMFRKDPVALQQWDSSKIRHCNQLQKDITRQAVSLLDEGGCLIYSTCTFNRMENEDVALLLMKEFGLQPVSISGLPAEILQLPEASQVHTYRCMPHRMEGEGLSFTVLQKPGYPRHLSNLASHKKPILAQNPPLSSLVEANSDLQQTNINENIYAIHRNHSAFIESLLVAGCDVLTAGIPLGHLKGKDWFPAHGLAMCSAVSNKIARMSLEKSQSLDYLRADSAKLPQIQSKELWLLAGYRSANLGWIKNIQGKGKNYLPKNQRIHSL